jgi:hypothetical protein
MNNHFFLFFLKWGCFCKGTAAGNTKVKFLRPTPALTITMDPIDDDFMDVDIEQPKDKMVKLSMGGFLKGVNEFWIPERLIKYSTFLQNQALDFPDPDALELVIVYEQENPELDARTIPKIIDYMNFMDQHNLKVKWEKPDALQLQLEEKHRFPFFANVSTPELQRILVLANFLEIEMLIISASRFFVLKNILDKTPQQIRDTLGIPDPEFTEKQKESMKQHKEVFRDLCV